MAINISLKKPRFIKACPSCGSRHLTFEGWQTYPAEYAERSARFAQGVKSGKFVVSTDKTEIGVPLFTCEECGSTHQDSK
jgi:hypothetical protein